MDRWVSGLLQSRYNTMISIFITSTISFVTFELYWYSNIDFLSFKNVAPATDEEEKEFPFMSLHLTLRPFIYSVRLQFICTFDETRLHKSFREWTRLRACKPYGMAMALVQVHAHRHTQSTTFLFRFRQTEAATQFNCDCERWENYSVIDQPRAVRCAFTHFNHRTSIKFNNIQIFTHSDLVYLNSRPANVRGSL